VCPVLDVSQYDAGVTFIFTIYKDGQVMNLGGYIAAIYGVKPDRHVFLYSAACEEATVSFKSTSQMCAVPGDTICEIRIMSATTDENIGTGNFILNVEESPLQYAGDFSDNDIPGVLDIAKAQAAAASASVSQQQAARSETSAHNSAISAENSDNSAQQYAALAHTSEDNARVSAEGAAGVVKRYVVIDSKKYATKIVVTNGIPHIEFDEVTDEQGSDYAAYMTKQEVNDAIDEALDAANAARDRAEAAANTAASTVASATASAVGAAEDARDRAEMAADNAEEAVEDAVADAITRANAAMDSARTSASAAAFCAKKTMEIDETQYAATVAVDGGIPRLKLAELDPEEGDADVTFVNNATFNAFVNQVNDTLADHERRLAALESR